jgi:hypothetical protein
MPNGSPGDHPLTDLINHNIPLYGGEIDELIKTIARKGKEDALMKIQWYDRKDFFTFKKELDSIINS